ncbi:hypothetical protein BT63DRAFT_424726 [Microthyrium microscopicum]|uniref:Uncharacterized protein n=1 Tax=Microthyrium microscopicum TaxID=703497 RepID=A0A6A6UAM0_9PEZI|nr:hypothetical protein BT63DRAFT_424726 [Microthyrium microscopicum]
MEAAMILALCVVRCDVTMDLPNSAGVIGILSSGIVKTWVPRAKLVVGTRLRARRLSQLHLIADHHQESMLRVSFVRLPEQISSGSMSTAMAQCQPGYII